MLRPSLARPVLALAALLFAGCSSKSSTAGSAGSAQVNAPEPAPSPRSTRGMPPPLPAAPARNVEVPDIDKLAHKPMFVVTERNPWAMVIGSDVPTAVLYEDGLVIYQRVNGERAEAMRGQWTPAEARSFVDELIKAGFLELPLRGSLVASTDQPTVEILLRSGKAWHLSSMYGMHRGGKQEGGSEPPRAFADAFSRAVALDVPGAVPWKPDEIEVMLWDFSHARDAVEWPAGVPKPPAGVKPPAEGVYKHIIDGKFEGPVRSFLSSNGNHAVSLNGQKWSMSLRRRIPEEDFVQKARMACYSAK